MHLELKACKSIEMFAFFLLFYSFSEIKILIRDTLKIKYNITVKDVDIEHERKNKVIKIITVVMK